MKYIKSLTHVGEGTSNEAVYSALETVMNVSD